MKKTLAGAAAVVVGGLALFGASVPAVKLEKGECARQPSDGGVCVAKPSDLEVGGRTLPGGLEVRGARTKTRGPVVYGQCELYACPPEP